MRISYRIRQGGSRALETVAKKVFRRSLDREREREREIDGKLTDRERSPANI